MAFLFKEIKMSLLSSKLENWDGKSTDDLRHIYASIESAHLDYAKQQSSSLIDELIRHLPQHPIAATWLVKHAIENDHSLSLPHSEKLLKHLLENPPWQSMLHILQISEHLIISNHLSTPFYAKLRHNLSHDNKFIRAWSYHALAVLAKQYAKFEKEVDELLAMALKGEAPSVKARVRGILKTRGNYR